MKVTRLNENMEVIAESLITEEVDTSADRFVTAMADYRKFANLDESVTITEEMIDEWALNEAACKNNCVTFDLKNRLLGEDITIDQAAKSADADKVQVQTENQIVAALNRALASARDIQEEEEETGEPAGDYPNILLVGQAGTAKTSVVKQWAKANGINLVYKDAKTMDPSALGGIVARDVGDTDYAKRLGTKEFQTLDAPNSVLFLDEYNRAKSEIRGSLLTLVQDHIVWDPKAKGEMRHVANFLFTIAAINPSGATYKGAKEMDPAERSRFRRINIQMNPAEHLKYLVEYYTRKINKAKTDEQRLAAEGRLALAKKLLESPKFAYDTIIDEDDNYEDDAYIPLNYRSLKKLLDDCDGTKKDFIDLWSEYCNYKKKNMIVDILSDFVDVKDKANDALKTETKSTVFNRTLSNREKLRNLGLNV